MIKPTGVAKVFPGHTILAVSELNLEVKEGDLFNVIKEEGQPNAIFAN